MEPTNPNREQEISDCAKLTEEILILCNNSKQSADIVLMASFTACASITEQMRRQLHAKKAPASLIEAFEKHVNTMFDPVNMRERSKIFVYVDKEGKTVPYNDTVTP
jgi:hypothetical protein